MVQMTRVSDASIILDIGCGRGELLQIVARKFTRCDCVGIDIAKGLRQYRRETGNYSGRLPNAQLLEADCENLPFRPRSLQLVFCASVLEHLPDPVPAVAEMARVLQAHGELLVGVPTENQMYRIARKLARFQKPIDHFHKSDDLEAILENAFVQTRARNLPFFFVPKFLSLYRILEYSKRVFAVGIHGEHALNKVWGRET
jgi:ubiquinone/menaquinone biosynthesis C-methylase UbiE